MHVLQLTRDYPPAGRGGISTAVASSVEALVDAGVSSTVVSFDGYRPSRDGGRAPSPVARARVGAAEVLRVSTPAQLPALHTTLEEVPFELVHVHDALLWELAARLRDDRGVRALATVHVLQRTQNRLRGLDHPTASGEAEAAMLREADRVLVPSGPACEQLRADHPDCGRELRVCALATAARPQAPLDGPPHLVSVGRFGDTKGTLELLDAVGVLAAHHPQLRVSIAGGMPDNRKAERRWLRRADERLPVDVRARVELMGWLEPPAVEALLQRATLFMAPSWYESFGLAVLEAMASGLPIVACNGGGTAALIEHGVHGLLCPPRDAAALVARAQVLLRRTDDARRMGHAARERARVDYCWPAVLPALQRAYTQC